MKDLKDLQEIINQKALDRFNKDFNDVAATVRASRLFSDMQLKITAPNEENPKMMSFYWIFNNNESNFIYNQLKDQYLADYISKESASFVNSVEAIRNDVDNLLDNQHFD